MNRKRLLVFAAVLAVGVALAVYFEPTRCVRGWLWGEAFFDARPTSFWAAEIEQWEYTFTVTTSKERYERYDRRSSWPRWVEGIMPAREAEWPHILDGDANGLLVLHDLGDHPSHEVRDWARIGLERIHRDKKRGPYKTIAFRDE